MCVSEDPLMHFTPLSPPRTAKFNASDFSHPFLSHTLYQKDSSVLSLAVNATHIFSGSQGTDIYVWDRKTLQLETTLIGHSGSVLALELSEEKAWLFSSAGDSTVRIWCTETLTPLYTILPHSYDISSSAGDIFSLSYCLALNTLFFGCQNTSLQWLDLTDPERALQQTQSPIRQRPPHRFFDSQPRGSVPGTPGLNTYAVEPPSRGASDGDPGSFFTRGGVASSPLEEESTEGASGASDGSSVHCPSRSLQVPASNVIESAHYGYIYCMALVPCKNKSEGNVDEDHTVQLVTGSEDVKLWSIRRPSAQGLRRISPILSHTFTFTPPSDSNLSADVAALSLLVRNRMLYAGCQDGIIHIWDLDMSAGHERVRSLVARAGADVLSISLVSNNNGGDGDLYACLADGWILRYSSSFAVTHAWKAHEGIVLSSVLAPSLSSASARTGENELNIKGNDRGKHTWMLITGANDNYIKLWGIDPPTNRYPLQATTSNPRIKETSSSTDALPVSTLISSLTNALKKKGATAKDVTQQLAATSEEGISLDAMVYALSEFVSIPSISNIANDTHREDCRRAAKWLSATFESLGAESTVLPSPVEGKNPLVLGTFRATASTSRQTRRPRILFYGHYDVIRAPLSIESPVGINNNAPQPYRVKRSAKQTADTSTPQQRTWSSPPFTLTGLTGYLYGRGVTDNKGPILAVACAVSDLAKRGVLDVDVVMLVEGEEEAGSKGFEEGVRKYKNLIGEIDSILVSNSYWIGEDTPCITYGLRGVVHSTLEISSDHQDLHSGVEGGAAIEPMMDMVKLIATLSNSRNRVQIPSFYDHVRPQPHQEIEAYRALAKVAGKQPQTSQSLTSRWREPSLTVHNIVVSPSNNSTVIPSRVRAQVSLRIVPDQKLDEIVTNLKAHLRDAFASFDSPNKLEISIDRTADWWLGELDDQWFRALEKALSDEWGVQPLRIREGGSIPAIPWLEKEFKCRALHLPMGQSSDEAHLQNERISLNNLAKGRSVVERYLLALSDPDFHV